MFKLPLVKRPKAALFICSDVGKYYSGQKAMEERGKKNGHKKASGQ
jgi:hypothetical protein